MPPVGALLKPFGPEAVFVVLCIAFLRVDAAAFRSYLERPTIVLAAIAWTFFGNRHTHDHDWPCRACLRGILRGALLSQSFHVLERRSALRQSLKS